MFTTKFLRFGGIDSKTLFSETDEDEFLYLVKKDPKQENSFGVSRKLNTETAQNRNKPFLYGFHETPMVIELRFSKQNPWTFEQRMTIVDYLYSDNFKELVFYEDDETGFYPIYFFCVMMGEPKFSSFSNENGYVDVKLTCDAAHGWGNVANYYYNMVDESQIREITVDNLSNIRNFILPRVEIEITNTERRTVENSLVVEKDLRGNSFVRLENWPPIGRPITVTKTGTPETISNPVLDQNILYLDNAEYNLAAIVDVDYEDYTVTMLNADDLTNSTDEEKLFKVSGLYRGEIIKIDNQNKLIGSNLEISRVSNFNKNWLRIFRGVNNITVSGSAIIKLSVDQPIGI